MRLLATCITLIASFAAAGCGESAEDRAQSTVCGARADISEQVDSLKAMTPASFTTDAVSQSLNAIRSDLADIRNAQQDLGDDRRQQVQDANQAFASEVQSVLQEVLRSTSAADAKEQVTSALQQLAATYEQTYARIDCS